MKLYKVTTSFDFSSIYREMFSFAKDPNHAYQMVRSYLDGLDVGTPKNREMKSIELIAEAADSPNCGSIILMG